MNETVGVVRERERERVRRLKTGVFSFNAESIKNARKIYKIDKTNITKINRNKRIDCLAKVENRVMQIVQVMHKDNICTKLLKNSLSFLRVKDKFAWKKEQKEVLDGAET